MNRRRLGPMHAAPARRGRAAGFTLVEVLVAMTLFSTVMLAMGAAMRTMAQSEVRVDERLQRADEMRVAANFLASVAGRVSPRRSGVPTAAGGSTRLFAGEPQGMAWVGVMPARFGAGGRYFFRLALEPSGATSALVVRYAPWNPLAVFPDWNTAESRVLVPDVTALRIDYAEPEQDVAWVSRWTEPERLPSRVRVSVATATEEWPPMVIAMRALGGSSGSRGGFSLGPE